MNPNLRTRTPGALVWSINHRPSARQLPTPEEETNEMTRTIVILPALAAMLAGLALAGDARTSPVAMAPAIGGAPLATRKDPPEPPGPGPDKPKPKRALVARSKEPDPPCPGPDRPKPRGERESTLPA